MWTGLLVVVASMVGVGILTTSGYIIDATGNHFAMLLLWVLGGVLAVAAALTVAEMATALPHVGGDYVYVHEAYGGGWGFVYGWATFLCGFAGPISVVGHVSSEYLLRSIRPLVAADSGWHDLILSHPARLAAGWIVVLTSLHCLGQRESAWVQFATTAFKIGTLLLLVVAGLASPNGSYSHFAAGTPISEQAASPLAVGLIYVMYSYTGWNAAAYLGGEIRDPKRNLPRCLVGGCVVVMGLYLLLNLVYAYALDPREIQKLPDSEVEPVAQLAAQQLFGPRITGVLSMAIGLGVLASLSAYILTGPRVALAMARRGLFPKAFGRLHADRGTPVPALILQGMLSLIFLSAGTFRQLLDFTSVGLALLSGLMISSIFLLRRRSDLVATFRVPLYPLPPVLYMVFTAWMVCYTVYNTPIPSLICIGSILLAIPFYHIAFAKSSGMS